MENFAHKSKGSTRLQKLSLMNNTYFGAIHYDIHLDMKLGYTMSRTFQEISLSELETIHHLCVYVNSNEHKFTFSPTRITKIPFSGCLLSGKRSNQTKQKTL